MTLRRIQSSTGCVMSLSEFVNNFLLFLNIYLQFCAVEYTRVYVHTNVHIMFLCKYTQFCGDTCMHIYYENKHFMKVNWYINNSAMISFSSRRQSLTPQWRDRGGEGNGSEVQEGCSGWEQRPTNSPLPQIWAKLEVLGQVLGVSQWSQITFAQRTALWPTERNILVCFKPVA